MRNCLQWFTCTGQIWIKVIKKTLYIQVFLFVSHVVSSTFELHTASLPGVSNRIGVGEKLSDVDSTQLSPEAAGTKHRSQGTGHCFTNTESIPTTCKS